MMLEDHTATERVRLVCHYCFHWEKGRRTKEQIAAWLRVHRSAGLSTYDGDLELASTCPHPCGSDWFAGRTPCPDCGHYCADHAACSTAPGGAGPLVDCSCAHDCHLT